jgi:hypothetical protein
MKHIDLDVDLIETMSELHMGCSKLNCILKLNRYAILDRPISQYGININGIDFYVSLLIFGDEFNHLVVEERINGKKD